MKFNISYRKGDRYKLWHLHTFVNSYQWHLYIGPFCIWLCLDKIRVHPRIDLKENNDG